jgi:hypothetical protein
VRGAAGNLCASVRLSLLVLSLFLTLPAAGAPLDERPRIQEGLWVLTFLDAEEREDCSSVIRWVESAAEAFPEFSFVLCYGTGLPEEGALLSGGVLLYDDPSGEFGRALGVESAPDVLVMIGGKPASSLVWPFQEGDLLRAVALASVLAESMPTTGLLVGREAPLFVGKDSDGTDVGLWEMDYPLLLIFVSPGCPSCWATLECLGETTREARVLLIVIGDSRGLLAEDEAVVALFADRSDNISWLLLQNQRVVEAYMLVKVPTFVVVDEGGRVSAVHEGWASEEELASLVSKLTGVCD